MKVRLMVAVVVCVVLASSAYAQVGTAWTARAVGMGGAGIAVADDAAAWFQNPAGLAALNVPCPEGAEYGSDAMFSIGSVEDDESWSLTWSGWKPADSFGAGAGYFDPAFGGHAFGVGFGAGFKNMPLSFGLNVTSVQTDHPVYNPYPDQIMDGGDYTTLNAGAMYRFGSDASPFKVGVVANDLTNELYDTAIFNAGASWMPVSRLLVAVDVLDVTDETEGDMLVNGGVEYGFSAGEGRTIFGRAGLADNGEDHDVTVGIGYAKGPWHLDFAWADTEPDSVWSFGFGVNL